MVNFLVCKLHLNIAVSKNASEVSKILLLTFHLLFRIKTCLCRERPKGPAAPARGQLLPLSIWPQPCGPGGHAQIPCCSSDTRAGPPGEKRQGFQDTEKSEMPVSKYVNVGQGREEAELEGNGAKSIHRSRATPLPENRGAQLGRLNCAHCSAVREQRQEQDSSQGTWEHCTHDPINLVNRTNSYAFSIEKFVTFRFL